MIGAIFAALKLFSGRIIKLATDHPKEAIIILLAIFSAFTAWKSHHWHNRYSAERIAHRETRESYDRAQRVAGELNAAQIAQRVAYYENQAKEKEREYEKALHDNRAAVDRWLRAQNNPRNSGGTGTGTAAPMPGTIVPGTGEAVIPETTLIPVADLYIVADTYAQCEGLRQWALAIERAM